MGHKSPLDIMNDRFNFLVQHMLPGQPKEKDMPRERMNLNPVPRRYKSHRADANANKFWGPEQSARAIRQGWDVFDCGDGLEIQRIDSPEDGTDPFFSSDAAALSAVQEAAAGGNELARAALDEVAMWPRGTVKPASTRWLNLFPGKPGWYFVETTYGIFPLEVLDKSEMGMDAWIVRGVYLGAISGYTMENFLRMYKQCVWYGPIEVPEPENF